MLHFINELPLNNLQHVDILLLLTQLVVEHKPLLIEMLHRRLPVPVIYSFSVSLPAIQRLICLPVLVQSKFMFPLIGTGLAAGEYAPRIVISLVLLPVIISMYACANCAGQFCVFLPSACEGRRIWHWPA